MSIVDEARLMKLHPDMRHAREVVQSTCDEELSKRRGSQSCRWLQAFRITVNSDCSICRLAAEKSKMLVTSNVLRQPPTGRLIRQLLRTAVCFRNTCVSCRPETMLPYACNGSVPTGPTFEKLLCAELNAARTTQLRVCETYTCVKTI
jgi:hypothetical protein